MTETPTWFLVAQTIACAATAIATIAMVFTILVGWRQLRAMEESSHLTRQQLEDLQSSRSRQQLYEIATYLLSNLTGVETVISLAGKPLAGWTADEREAARVVCSHFHLVGALVQEQMVPELLFAKLWYYSVPQCHVALKPYLEEIRRERGPNYWSRFDWLAERVREHNKDIQGWPITTTENKT